MKMTKNNMNLSGLPMEAPQKPSDPVTCLGMTFENDEARRTHFTEKLREKLRDPEFRKIEGFPIGDDEDILNLSNPPYYTACPNPWIADFIAEWEAQKPEQAEGYHREPFAADVSEGKNNPIYNAHTYHTKVPHKAIMRYILHYTQPGDIVLDGFCGTGMTGVAAQMCGDREAVMSLGYLVKPNDSILETGVDEDGKTIWMPFSKLGVRRAVLNELSPVATSIAHSFNTPVDIHAFDRDATRILAEVEEECSWMYETKHSDGRTGKINYTVWSDVFVCPDCTHEVVFWEVSIDKEADMMLDNFPCPHCSSALTKRKMERAWITRYDSALKKSVKQAKQVLVLINYIVDGKRTEKTPDSFDLALMEKIESSEVPFQFPKSLVPEGDKTNEPLRIGITHVHHFYTKRNLWVLASALHKAFQAKNPRLIAWVTSSMTITTKMYRFRLNRKMGILSGTLFIPSLGTENVAFKLLRRKIGDMKKAGGSDAKSLTGCNSFENLKVSPESIDYIFIDPPFGANLSYSELNFIWESWLRVWVNNKSEAIENRTQGKGPHEYRQLMTACFREAYRVLKPGHWMTVEFSNTKASVWNSIQTAIGSAGFILGDVSALDKKQGTFNAATSPTAVKQDLVITAYKPNGGFEERFQKKAKTEEGVWEFVRSHLKYLPITKHQSAVLQPVPERDPRILFDQMVAYHVRKGYPVPISSKEFQIGLEQRFLERDGMYFLPHQVAEYDQKKATTGELKQLSIYVSDEATAIQWLRQLINKKPQIFSDINTQFMQQLGGWSKNETQLDLKELLDQNFLCYDGKGPVPEQIHAYLSSNLKSSRKLPKDDPARVAAARDRWYVPDPSKEGDLEKVRDKALLKEFKEYKETKKRLRIFRIEAVRAGFKEAWQARDYDTIVAVANKIPNNVLEGDPKLLMWYGLAVTRAGDE